MKDYIGSKNHKYYLINLDNDEGYEFSEYGVGLSNVSAKYVVTLGVSLREVDIISILGNCIENDCEIYFQGARLKVPINALKLYGMLKGRVSKVSYLAFKISRAEEEGLSQYLIPTMKGTVSRVFLSDLLKLDSNSWF